MKKKYIISIGTATLIVLGYLIADSILFNGVKPQQIIENGFQANFFAKENVENKAVVILIGGGQWGDYWAHEIANNKLAALSLPYIGRENLPDLPEEIDLKYFKNAINWLQQQNEVDSEKIIVMGASRNAELALIIASTFPDIVGGVIVYAPSSVAWSNTVLPYNSNELKASWKNNGVDIPYVPMDKIAANESNQINMLEYWENGLAKTNFVEKASIKVENIKGPVLLFSGIDDKVWPSEKMADMIEKRLKDTNFKYNYINIKYENAGHLISNNPEQLSNIRTGKINIDGKVYDYDFGGTDNGDSKAKKDAYIQVFKFLSNLKND